MPWNLSYAGRQLPPPDSGGLGFELQPIDKADRNANGDTVIEVIALKRKLTYSRSRLNGEQARELFSALENNRTGILNYYDVSKGAQTSIQVYYGAGAKTNYIRYDAEGKKQIYSSVSVNFIEM